ncbi:MAG TPA: 23S rRNA (pseudouridine(1915)-N(3))-methyltransferase RlmH [Spongiibacteraceae bacterium]|jgi:23S rRNA (pseudouridine1915-N3)-methyltransferase|nr:23S rRNA (pseudouridine(1915)-N(3))-methyltransferase RlmH [Spongiibacteraceae bacterium]HUH37822.1 23S rRNA (pseudouridine(1915)-N(3))-methyltransferase RlmH [Spongiibacteraceae bacterium]
MRITVVAVGNRMPGWVDQAVADYRKRLPPELPLLWRDIPLAQRGKNADLKRAIHAEGEQMLAALDPRERVIALDVQGTAWSTEQLAEALAGWQMDGRNLSLLIGGPDGLAPACLARAERRWSLSPLTLPHPLVRVVLAEQLYRAWSINANHPYHRQG